MINNKFVKYIGLACMPLLYTACKVPTLTSKDEQTNLPNQYVSAGDSTNIAAMQWKEYFTDPDLQALIDTALVNNQELNITLQEIQIANNEVRARTGEYLPFVTLGASGEGERASKYTLQGATEDAIDIRDGHKNPDPLTNVFLGAQASWEIDIWNKLHNAKKAAVERYLSSIEGKNFIVTNLIGEIANSYYELLALDNQLSILQNNVKLQSDALEIVKAQKIAARATELAVKKFEAEVAKTKSMQYEIQQNIVEAENRINFLCGRYPQHIVRDDQTFNQSLPSMVNTGVPTQLLENRPDVRRAEFELAATKLDVKSAKARFYPSLDITAGLGLDAFSPQFIFSAPKSILANLAADFVGPLVNRNAIKAAYMTANSKQIQAVYNYQRTVLNAYIEVYNQVNNIQNLKNNYELKSQQVDALNQSISISNDLFKYAKADYMEVLMTQRDYLESKFDLIETQMLQRKAMVNIYKSLGGGWK